MSGSVYEFIATKNKELAKFFDENHQAAKLVMKLVRLIGEIAIANRASAEQMTFDVYAPKGGNVIVIKIQHPDRSISC